MSRIEEDGKMTMHFRFFHACCIALATCTHHHRGEESTVVHDALANGLKRLENRTRVLLGGLPDFHHNLGSGR